MTKKKSNWNNYVNRYIKILHKCFKSIYELHVELDEIPKDFIPNIEYIARQEDENDFFTYHIVEEIKLTISLEQERLEQIKRDQDWLWDHCYGWESD